MNEGDYVVAINEEDVKWSPHDEVVSLIKSSGNNLKLKLVTPMDKSHSKENKVCISANYLRNILNIILHYIKLFIFIKFH